MGRSGFILPLVLLEACAERQANPASDPFQVYERLSERFPGQCHFTESNDGYGGANNEPKLHIGVFSCEGVTVPTPAGTLTSFTLRDQRSYHYEHLRAKGSTGSNYLMTASYEFADGTTVRQTRGYTSNNASGLADGTFGKSGVDVSRLAINWDPATRDELMGSGKTAISLLDGVFQALSREP